MKAITLRAIAASWLRYERRCWLVTFERGLEYNNNPDVLGVNPSRFLIEVEVKVSISDFRADAKKGKWSYREAPSQRQPKFMYYMVPQDLVDKVTVELKPGFGLLTTSGRHNGHTGLPELKVMVEAKAQANARRLDIHHIAKLVKHQSATLAHLAAYEGRIAQEKENEQGT